MLDLVTIVPSRGRPEQALKLARQFNLTIDADSEIAFVVDHDDPTKDDYQRIAGESLGKVIVGYHKSMVDALNQHAVAVADSTFAIAFMGDDHWPQTFGWDESYVATLQALGTGMVFGNDLFQGPALPTQIAMTADIVYTLGWMAPPGLTHLYVDDFWLKLGHDLGFLRYLPEVVVEHIHPAAGKGEWTEGHTRVNSAAMYDIDSTELTRIYESGEYSDAFVKLRALTTSA